jgi:hypothetical protein
MRQAVRVKSVELLDGYRVRLTFTDGTSKEADLEVYLRGPVFDEIHNDPQVFRAIRVDEELGTVVWPNGADIDPDVLYFGLKPAWMEDENRAAIAPIVK